MTTETVPKEVLDALSNYRTAVMVGRTSYERQREAATRGDKATVGLLEKGRQDRVLRVNRTRIALDEAVRKWAEP